MDKLFIPYHLAVKMKEIGFQELCLGSYYTDASENNLSEKHDYREQFYGLEYHPMDKWGTEWEPNFIRNSESVYYVSAPTWGQAFDWIRDNFNLYSNIDGFGSDIDDNIHYFEYQIYKTQTDRINNQLNILDSNTVKFNKYEEAELECLDKLIEIVQKEKYEY